MRYRQVLEELTGLGDRAGREGMARFGIETSRALGVSVVKLRSLAKRIGRDHELALQLWRSGIHEARLLAAFVDEPAEVSEEQMEAWAAEFDSWDLVDQCCGSLFDKSPFAYRKAVEWSAREEEFVKRAGFALMASLAVHDTSVPDEVLGAFLPVIEREAVDRRNYVRKAVNWALRQIGKRSPALNAMAVKTAERIQTGPREGRWVASDALRELKSEPVQSRLRARRPPRGSRS